jgi:cytochrome P450
MPKFQHVQRANALVRDEMLRMLAEAKDPMLGESVELKKDLLTSLAKANAKANPLTDKEQLADVWMFSLAAMETTSHTLSWIMMRMAFHPDVQQRVYDEACKFEGRFEEVSAG